MKVKANYGINCDRGYFETGEIFDIDAKDFSMYGDAVTVVDRAPEPNAEPAKKPETKAPETGGTGPAEEKQATPRRTTRKRA